jgi:hypothetical protein
LVLGGVVGLPFDQDNWGFCGGVVRDAMNRVCTACRFGGWVIDGFGFSLFDGSLSCCWVRVLRFDRDYGGFL